MCGIAGIFSPQGISEKLIGEMLNAIAHRGPDQQSFYSCDNYTAGMCRLSINDPEYGSQPLFNETKSVSLLYNGEIYNSPRLRSDLISKGYRFRTDSDGEVICHLFDEYGIKMLSMLDGMFAISLWDSNTNTLYLARDSSAEKPLYYASIPHTNSIVFSSEIKAIKSSKLVSLSLNMQAIWDFPTFLWIPEPSTIFNEIVALERGHFLTVSNGGVVDSEYIPLSMNFNGAPYSNELAIAETRRVVDDAIHSRLLSDVPVGSFLSGGLDSSIVATVASRELGPIDTFCVGFDDHIDPIHGQSDESQFAASYADQLGTNHHTIKVTSKTFLDLFDDFCYFGDQPFAVSSGFGILSVAKAANENGIKVLLSGDCADEQFGGYSWYKHLDLPYVPSKCDFNLNPFSFQNFGVSVEKRLDQLKLFNSHQRAWAWHYYAHEFEKASLFSPCFQESIKSSIRHFEDFDSSKVWDCQTFIDHDRSFYLPNEMLTKLDRMTMAFSVEGRVPFASPGVNSLAKHLLFSQLIENGNLKWVLRSAYSDILPLDLLDRPKHGFNVPIDLWLSNDWNHLVYETFSPSSALSKLGLLSKDALPIALEMLEDSSRLNGHTIFCFIALNRWISNCI